MDILNPTTLIPLVGLVGIGIIIFLETGIFFGVIFPGDSLLFTAGLFAAKGLISFPLLLLVCIVAAIAGDQIGYLIGKKLGPKLFTRKETFFFKKSYLEKTKAFYAKHGVKTIIIARFIPIVRTFAPTLAGAGEMDYKTFTKYNIVGGILWVLLFCYLGYFLAGIIGDNLIHLGYVVGIIIFVSLATGVWQFFVKRH